MRDDAVALRGRPVRRMRAIAGPGLVASFLGEWAFICVSSINILVYKLSLATENPLLLRSRPLIELDV
jgi:hypothetical protein